MTAPARAWFQKAAILFPSDWNITRGFRIPKTPTTLSFPYYIRWNPDNSLYGEDWLGSPLDPNGVLLTRDKSYHPVRIFQYGLHNHGEWSETDYEAPREAFLAQARWARDNQVTRDGVNGCYVYDVPLFEYGAKPGWISAMAQGQAVSLLLRAEAESPGSGFSEAALTAAEPFKHLIVEGGVVWRGPQDDVFFEEVAVLPPAHVLNGHLYALWGLYELSIHRRVDWIDKLLREALVTLRRRLPLFDSGYWSFYSLLATRNGYRRTAVLKYHAFHVAQLYVTAALFNESYYAEVATKWSAYSRSYWCRLRMIKNTIFGLFLRIFSQSRSVPGGERSVLPDA